MWKFLVDNQVQHELKVRAIKKIEMLGNGDWSRSLSKPLEVLPKQHNIKLNEAKLTKGGRILWELTISFSPRCTGNHDEIGKANCWSCWQGSPCILIYQGDLTWDWTWCDVFINVNSTLLEVKSKFIKSCHEPNFFKC